MQLFCILSKFGKIIQRGDPWDKKKLKCSNLDETCRTGGDHQKNKLGSDFEVCLHLVGVWATKNEKWCKGGTLGTKKNQSAPIWTKLAGLVGTIIKTSWEVILKCSCTLLGSEGSKSGGFWRKKNHQKWRIGSLFWTKSSLLRRKPPKVEVFQVLTKNLIKKKNSQSGGFSSFRNQKWRILFQNRQKV